MKVTLSLMKFLFIGALFIISNSNLHIQDKEDAKIFTNLFYFWLEGLFENSLSLAGYITYSEWLPQTNISEKNKDIEKVNESEKGKDIEDKNNSIKNKDLEKVNITEKLNISYSNVSKTENFSINSSQR